MPNATNDRELLAMVKAGRYSEKWNAVEERTDDPFNVGPSPRSRTTAPSLERSLTGFDLASIDVPNPAPDAAVRGARDGAHLRRGAGELVSRGGAPRQAERIKGRQVRSLRYTALSTNDTCYGTAVPVDVANVEPVQLALPRP